VPLQNLATELTALTNEVKSSSKEVGATDEESATFREVFKISYGMPTIIYFIFIYNFIIIIIFLFILFELDTAFYYMLSWKLITRLD
jgi:hypothetical protein